MPELLDTRLRLRTPGDLIAAVPVLMGFHPRSSLVAIAMGGAAGGRIGLTIRIDLPPPGDEAAAAAAAVQAVLTGRPVGVVVLVVAPPHPLEVPPAVELVELVTAGLLARGVAVQTSLWAGGTTEGDRWRCYGACGCHGVVPDPTSSEAMARSVTLGRVVAEDREALTQRVAAVDPVDLLRRDTLIGERINGTVDNRPDHCVYSTAERADTPAAERLVDTAAERLVDTAAERLVDTAAERLVDTAVAAAAAGVLVLDDERIVDLAMALGRPAVRDAAVRHCLGPDAGVAADLWARLARETPDPEAADPAALVALSALLHGAGAMAQVALDRAQQAWPGHRLSRLIQGLVDARIDPSELRACLAGPGLDQAYGTGRGVGPGVRGVRARG